MEKTKLEIEAIETMREAVKRHDAAQQDAQTASIVIHAELSRLDYDDCLEFGEQYPEFQEWVDANLFSRRWLEGGQETFRKNDTSGIPNCPNCGQLGWTFNREGHAVCSCGYVTEEIYF